jgi:exodeoxyribonuclease V alpha subunit
MLSRQLLYTAVTRAKRRVVLVGNRKGLQAAIKDASPAKRNTELAELLREGMEQVA